MTDLWVETKYPEYADEAGQLAQQLGNLLLALLARKLADNGISVLNVKQLHGVPQ